VKQKKRKRASSFLTGVILLVLILGMGVQLYRQYERLQQTRAEEAELIELHAQLTEENRQLAEDIENADDPELIEKIAREELNMLNKNGKVFYFTGG